MPCWSLLGFTFYATAISLFLFRQCLLAPMSRVSVQ
ncbi:hypothetical protein NC653_005471 [Populus alba x Populus x berolinensis]|uniref:Uncharacterized protein n=1 Tax=Populus alba x Populus x berolinensis TaxID=444605 RepID=A0AAD6WBW3_9ROSI|nr:hypothetical protein NC653_005471 [Populus alba x Populus x berolinensis]